jgi:glycogen operon protein
MRLEQPGWNDDNARVLAFTLAGLEPHEEHLHVILNLWDRALEFELPRIDGRRWFKAVDTFDAPSVHAPDAQPAVDQRMIRVQARSVVVLEAREESG